MRIKICGITKPEQAIAIAQLGATDLGFICASSSPRYVTVTQIELVGQALQAAGIAVGRIGVFVNASLEEIGQVVAIAGLTAVQLHGQEPVEFCQALRQTLAEAGLPKIELWKAFRIRAAADLAQVANYTAAVDAVLLDAYHPNLMGGTGQTLNWQDLQGFAPACPWFLAGGLTPDNVMQALQHVQPDGIDLSSGVERSPGDKDLQRVAQLFTQLANREIR